MKIFLTLSMLAFALLRFRRRAEPMYPWISSTTIFPGQLIDAEGYVWLAAGRRSGSELASILDGYRHTDYG
jgi:hypothetical protein